MDAFTREETTQHALAFEKAAVLYNLSNVIGGHAATQNLVSTEGVKIAYNHFCKASGVIEYISTNFLHAPSFDLNKDVLDIMNRIYIAQAQECFLLTSLSKPNFTLVSKISSFIASLYSIIIEKLKDQLAYDIIHEDYCLISNVYI